MRQFAEDVVLRLPVWVKRALGSEIENFALLAYPKAMRRFDPVKGNNCIGLGVKIATDLAKTELGRRARQWRGMETLDEHRRSGAWEMTDEGLIEALTVLRARADRDPHLASALRGKGAKYAGDEFYGLGVDAFLAWLWVHAARVPDLRSLRSWVGEETLRRLFRSGRIVHDPVHGTLRATQLCLQSA